MSKGIIVVGGAEEEHYNLLGKDRLHPIINVYPEVLMKYFEPSF